MSTYSGISIAERDRYRSIFTSLGPINSVVTGDQCRSVFLQSDLPQAQLQQIWELADLDQDGTLDVEEFIIAMRLIYDTLNGVPVPNVIPEHMVPPIKQALAGVNPSVDPLARAAGVPGIPTLASMGQPAYDMGMSMGMGSGMGSDPSMFASQMAGQVLRGPSIEFTDTYDWYMPPAEKLKYEMEFERAPTENDLLAKHHAYEAFLLSRRPNDEFEILWSIVDLHGQGAISADQYVCMQHILNMRKSNKPFPRSLPPEVIAKFKSVTSRTPAAGMSRSTSGALNEPAKQPVVVTASDDAKVKALEEELAFLQRELAKLSDTSSGTAEEPSLVKEFEQRAAKMQEVITWVNEHLGMLPTKESAAAGGGGAAGQVELAAMLSGLKDELVVAEAQFAREKSTTI
ncbi:cytoskeletal-regulatory complex EF hand-domain-containing protein [Catenaria anguillulae PL171]|uniref:Cytoskeletal-regulatory complex EF hand-domain-containing protein n=1 Tax=Catenaria anguillulae PL171 TaxID=765915 RepID=A0A1Y2HI14_9FUNG|nr:cytoskeletal-regulatory complex EF hand-domain-containing protein [Catenaria anguillulae PL171]